MNLYDEAENINDRLNRMNETELAGDYAQRLMDRLAHIRELERRIEWSVANEALEG